MRRRCDVYVESYEKCRNFLRNRGNAVCRYFLESTKFRVSSSQNNYRERSKASTCGPISIAVSNYFSRWRSDRYGLSQRKSLLSEYLIMPIISTRSHRGLHSNASWSTQSRLFPDVPLVTDAVVVEGLFVTPITTTAKCFRDKKIGRKFSKIERGGEMQRVH